MKLQKVCFVFLFLLLFVNNTQVYAAVSPTNEPVATASEVIVIYNSSYTTDSNSDTIQDSHEIANYYRTKRSIPDANVIGVSAPLTEVITRAEYNTLKGVVETAITNAGLENTAKYIVLVKGMPLKIYPTNGNTSSLGSDYASVDSAMTLLYQTNHNNGYFDGNPYFNADSSFTLNYRFKPNSISFEGVGNFGEVLKFLVTRLDGYTVADIKGMIDRAYNADTTGTGYYVLDGHTNLGSNQNSDAHSVLKNLNKNVYPDPYSVGLTPITNAPGNVIGYTSHGKYSDLPADYYNNTLDFTYLNGAVTSTYESWTNYTYTQDSTPSSPYENHGQVAEFIQAGGSGGVGNVYEPFNIAIAQEDIWMPAYSVGYTWADAVYMSLQYIDWTAVVTGDPLMVLIDYTRPTISSITSDTNSGAYKEGDVIDIDITFSESVTSNGDVTVTLETGSTDRTCLFTIINNSTASCNYTVQAGDTSSDLNIISISGTISDQSNNSMSNFVPTANLAVNEALVIDTTAPELSSVFVNTTANTATITWTTDEVASSSISYGQTISYSTTTPETDITPGVTSHSVAITSLNCSTEYNYVVISKDALDHTSSSANSTFTTLSCPVVSSGGGGGGSSSGKPKAISPIVDPVKIINLPITSVQRFTQSSLIRVGSRGENVKVLQTFLNAQGPDIFPPNSKIDGVFGKITDQAVKKFQTKNNLKADGIVGKNTKLAIDSLNTKKYCFVSVNIKTC